MIKIVKECHNSKEGYFNKGGLSKYMQYKNEFLSLPTVQKDLHFIEEQKKKYGDNWPQVLLEEAKSNENQVGNEAEQNGEQPETGGGAGKKKPWEFWK